MTYLVWNDHASFVNMEFQLQQLNVPPRMSVQNKLLAAFGVNGDAKPTKDMREARAAMAGVAAGKKPRMTAKGKGKEKPATKKKNGKRQVTPDERTDEDEDENEDKDIHDDHDAWMESGEGEDHEGDGDGDTKEERARIQQVVQTKKHGDLIARHEEWEETHSVLAGSKQGTKTMPALNFNKSPPSFHKHWKKVSSLPTDRTVVAMRGLSLVDWTTWEWKNIPSQSFMRIMRCFAAAAIAEASCIISYRHEMILCQPYGGAMTIRIRAQVALAPLLTPKDPGQTRMFRQTTLKGLLGSASQGSKAGDGLVLTEGSLPPRDTITWADGIYPPVPEQGCVTHVIENELVRLERERRHSERSSALSRKR